MRRILLIAIIPGALISGCSSTERPYNFVMDYPVEASRLSLSGKLVAELNCDKHSLKLISDTSNGIFSRHVKNRVNSLCYGKKGTRNITYLFNAPRTPAYNMIATQPQRTPEFQMPTN